MADKTAQQHLDELRARKARGEKAKSNPQVRARITESLLKAVKQHHQKKDKPSQP